MAKPVERTAITSLWSPKMESAWVATARGRTWNDRRGQLARDLEHVGDHQQQALRGGEGGGQGAGLQRAVHRAGGAAFALHLDDRGDGAPDVLVGLRRPTRPPTRPCATRGDGIDGDDFVDVVGNVGGGLVAVELSPFF